jgi:cellulose synthase operon protein C
VFVMSSSFRVPSNIRFVILALAATQLASCSSPEERAKSYYEHGKQLLAAHDNQRAEIEFRNAVKYNKNLLPAWQSLAEVEELTHNWGNLVPVLRSILELSPNDMSTRLRLARLLLMGRAYDDALRLVNDVNEADGQNADLLAVKGAILFKLKDTEGSVREAEAALKMDPTNTGAMFVLAGNRFAAGDAKGALAILDSPEMAKQPDPRVDLFKVQIFEQTQDLQQAEAILRQFVERNPKDLNYRRELIRIYLAQHRYEEAEKEQREIIAADPANVQNELNLAHLLNATKGPAAAQQQLETLISAGGDTFPYQIAVAQLNLAQGKFSEAVALLKSLIGGAGSSEHVVAAQIVLAEAYLSKKQMQDAETVVSDILNKDGRNTSGLKLRATIRMERGQLDLVIADLRAALNDKPHAADLMLMLAIAYERSGSIDLAEKEFADAMRDSNFDPAVSLNYVAFLQRRGSIAHAEDVLVDLASRWPRNPEILSALAQVRLTRQEWVGAQEVAETMRRLGANRVLTDELLGAALAGRNKYDESIVALQDAYTAAPTAAQPMNALVNTYLRAGKADQAISFLQTVLKANPSNVQAYVLLGSAQLANKSPDKARQSFMTAIEKGPTNVSGYLALSEFYTSQKNNDEALKVTRAGLKALPDSFPLALTLAVILERTGDYEGAISEYEKLLVKDPGSIIVTNNLASLLAEYRTDKPSLDRAQALAASLAKSPSPQFKDTQGWVDYRGGNYAAAVPLLEDAAAALPNLALVHYHLGMSYSAVGQPEKAAEQLKLALSRVPDHELEEKIHTALAKIGTQ